MISVVWSATCFSVFLARTSGFARASSTVLAPESDLGCAVGRGVDDADAEPA
jgi:hypothetical protein